MKENPAFYLSRLSGLEESVGDSIPAPDPGAGPVQLGSLGDKVSPASSFHSTTPSVLFLGHQELPSTDRGKKESKKRQLVSMVSWGQLASSEVIKGLRAFLGLSGTKLLPGRKAVL